MVKDIITNFIIDNFLFGESGNLKDDTDLFKNSIVDSTGILELIAHIEMSYNIKVEDEEIIQENFCSINSIRSYLKTKQVNQKDKICAE